MRWAAEGNRFISMPISETMACALTPLTPGIDVINATAVRKGVKPSCTCASILAMGYARYYRTGKLVRN
jgi:hypothetical protein